MGLTYGRSFLRSHIATEENMMILERSPEKAKALSTLDVGTIYGKPGDYMSTADLIIFAVKPQDIQPVFDSIRPYISDQQVFLSIMAGVTMNTIAEGLGAPKIIRAMPNLPAQTGLGMTVFTSSDAVTRIELVMVQNLINTTGKSIYVDSENMIDAATAISGSGPAYVFYFMDSLIKTAQSMGFSQSESELLVKQTFRGAVDLLIKNRFSCEEWIKMVSSKGGTTEAALKSYVENEVHSDIRAGAEAALHRAKELGLKY